MTYVVHVHAVDYRWNIEYNPQPHWQLADPKQTFFVVADPRSNEPSLEQVLENSRVLKKLSPAAVRIYPRTKQTPGYEIEDGFNVELRSAKAASLTFTELLAYLIELLDSTYTKTSERRKL